MTVGPQDILDGTVGQYKINKWNGEGHKDNPKELWVHVDELDMTVGLQRQVGGDSGTTGTNWTGHLVHKKH